MEQDEVLFVFNSAGTATNVVVRQYLNSQKVPHLFVFGPRRCLGDYQHYPLYYRLGQQLSNRGQPIRQSTFWRTGRTRRSQFFRSMTTMAATM